MEFGITCKFNLSSQDPLQKGIRFNRVVILIKLISKEIDTRTKSFFFVSRFCKDWNACSIYRNEVWNENNETFEIWSFDGE